MYTLNKDNIEKIYKYYKIKKDASNEDVSFNHDEFISKFWEIMLDDYKKNPKLKIIAEKIELRKNKDMFAFLGLTEKCFNLVTWLDKYDAFVEQNTPLLMAYCKNTNKPLSEQDIDGVFSQFALSEIGNFVNETYRQIDELKKPSPNIFKRDIKSNKSKIALLEKQNQALVVASLSATNITQNNAENQM